MQKTLEYKNAEAAVRVRDRMLRATEAMLVEMSSEQVMALIEPAMLKLLTDAETRGFGAPVQDIRSGDGSMTPKGLDVSGLSADALAEIMRAADASKPD